MASARQGKRRRRTLESLNKVMLGVVGLIMISALIAALLVVKAADIGHGHYTAQFSQAGALRVGSPITVAGIPVGEVTSMKLVGTHVEAGLKVRDDVAFGADSRAVIKVTTILGSRYLALYPAGSGSLPNRTFDLKHTEPPYDLQEALVDVTTTYEQLDNESFAKSLSILGTQLKTLPPVVPQALRNTQTLSTIIAQRRDQLGSLLKTTELVSNTLHRQQSTIAGLVNQGNSLVGDFVARQDAFRGLMAGLTDLVQNLSQIVVDDRPQLEELLTSLRELSDMLGKHDDLLRSTLQAGPIALRGLANASGTGNAVDLTVTNGLLIDSWMCAISGRAKQFNIIQYFQDCK